MYSNLIVGVCLLVVLASRLFGKIKGRSDGDI